MEYRTLFTDSLSAQCPAQHKTTHLQLPAVAFQETSCVQFEGAVTQWDTAVLYMQHLSKQVNGHLILLNVLSTHQMAFLAPIYCK